MPRRSRLLLNLAFVAMAATAWAVVGQQGEEIQSHPVAGNIWWLEGPGGNVGVSAGEDGVLLVDDKFKRTAPLIQEAVEKLSDGGELQFVINTHHHGDHTGGNGVFGTGASILAHENVRARLAGPQRDGRTTAKEALPVLTYGDGVTMYFNGEEIRILHVPNAHTDGDSIVWFLGSNVVHMGDVFFNGRFPYVDRDSGGSVAGFISAVVRVLEMVPEDVKIIPGHGDLGTRSDLETYLSMLRGCEALVAEALAAGKNADQMKLDKLLAEYDAWAWEFISPETFIDVLVTDLQAR